MGIFWMENEWKEGGLTPMSMRNCGFLFEMTRMIVMKAWRGRVNLSFVFKAEREYKLPIAVLKKSFDFLIVRRAKKLNYGHTKKSDLHLQSFYKQWISKVRDSKVCIDGHHSKYADYVKKALMGDGQQQPHVDRSNCFCKYQTWGGGTYFFYAYHKSYYKVNLALFICPYNQVVIKFQRLTWQVLHYKNKTSNG